MVQEQNYVILVALGYCSRSQTKQTFALTVLLPANIPDEQRGQTLPKMVVYRLNCF